MKATILKLSVFLLTSAIIVIGCKKPTEPEEEEIVIEIIDADTFFEKYLPVPALPRSKIFFVNYHQYDNVCVIINSIDELIENISSSPVKELPDIDFNSHTLIIGQEGAPASYYYIVKQNIVVDSEKIELNIIAHPTDGQYAGGSTLYYWGIYPKLPQKSVNIN